MTGFVSSPSHSTPIWKAPQHLPPRPAGLSKHARILVIRYRFIGDTLLTVPFLRNLRRNCPDATIDLLTGPQSGELLRDCPYINEIIPFDTTRKHQYEQGPGGEAPKSFWAYAQLLRQRKYDAVFVLKRSFSSAALAFLSGAPTRVGFDTEGRGFLLTRRVPYSMVRHERHCFLDLLEAAGLQVFDDYLESWWSPTEEHHAEQWMVPYAGGPNVALHLTSSHPGKAWPLDRMIALATRLHQNNPTMTFHVFGASSDEAIFQQFKGGLPGSASLRVKSWCGQTTLLESMAMLRRMDGIIGSDSGTLHMGSAVGIPVVALFGPMSESKWTPVGARVVTATGVEWSCRPCHLKVKCPYEYGCMSSIDPAHVLDAFQGQR